MLTDTNGLIKTLAYKITAFTPEMKTKKAKLQTQLKNVSFNYKLDPKLVLDGISMLVSLDKSPKSIANVLKYGYDVYKSTTVVKSNDGKESNKDFVISQITACGDTIDSLMESFKNRKDDTFELDDPGATKIIAKSADLQKIIDEYANALGEEQRSTIKAALESYVQTVTARNNAVVEYNAAVQQLIQAWKNKNYYAEQISKVATDLLDIDPELPGMVFWPRNMRSNLRLSVMQYQEYERQSIRFWGLEEGGVLSFSSSGGEMDYNSLSYRHRELRNAFDRSLGWYAGNIRVVWSRNKTDAGIFYKLPSSAEVEQLRQISTNGSDDHTIDTRLQEVRVWLFGAELPEADELKRKRVVVQTTHFGNEVILNNVGKEIKFAHDCVDVQFSYDMAKVEKLEDAKPSAIFSAGGFEMDFRVGAKPTESSRAPVGPYTKGKIQIRRDANPGIRLDGLREVYIEFQGSNRSRTAL